jgi:HAD superfamily hydrolase (TIGR01509 family)
MRLPRAVVFDCDGTLADTEPLSDRAWQLSLQEHGYDPTPEDFRAVIGHPFAQNFAYYSERVELGDPVAFRRRLRERFQHLVDTELRLHDDAVAALRTLVAADVPVAVASSSSHAHVREILELGGAGGLVEVVVGADDVERHKPDAEPYARAARELGVDPASCSAAEDTSVGVASARAAGMYTVAVLRDGTDRASLRAAHLVVERLTVESLLPPEDRERPIGRA